MVDIFSRPGRRRKQPPRPRELEDLVFDFRTGNYLALRDIREALKPHLARRGFLWDEHAEKVLREALRAYCYGEPFLAFFLDRIPRGDRNIEEQDGLSADAYVGTGLTTFEDTGASVQERLAESRIKTGSIRRQTSAQEAWNDD